MPRGQIAPPGDQIAFWASMRSLAAIVGRSGAPHLRLRLGVALVLTVAGKLTGVVAPLLLGQAVNRLSHKAGPVAQVGMTFAALVIGWALIRFLSAAACAATP